MGFVALVRLVNASFSFLYVMMALVSKTRKCMPLGLDRKQTI